jgi:transposase
LRLRWWAHKETDRSAPRPDFCGFWAVHPSRCVEPECSSRTIDPFIPYLRERVASWPGLTGRRLWRELRERGYQGGYSAVTDALRELRPPAAPVFEVRFETPPGDQAQVDFAQFQVAFADELGVIRIVWLFSLVLG